MTPRQCLHNPSRFLFCFSLGFEAPRAKSTKIQTADVSLQTPRGKTLGEAHLCPLEEQAEPLSSWVLDRRTCTCSLSPWLQETKSRNAVFAIHSSGGANLCFPQSYGSMGTTERSALCTPSGRLPAKAYQTPAPCSFCLMDDF